MYPFSPGVFTYKHLTILYFFCSDPLRVFVLVLCSLFFSTNFLFSDTVYQINPQSKPVIVGRQRIILLISRLTFAHLRYIVFFYFFKPPWRFFQPPWRFVKPPWRTFQPPRRFFQPPWQTFQPPWRFVQPPWQTFKVAWRFVQPLFHFVKPLCSHKKVLCSAKKALNPLKFTRCSAEIVLRGFVVVLWCFENGLS